MVQRKAANNKHLGIIAIKTEKRQEITKPTLENHDTKSKGADFKAIKMKKSRSIKRSDTHEAPRQPGKPPTPIRNKPSPCKSSHTSPNYMKDTSSSEARKEKTTKATSVLSTSKLHKAVKTLAKTCSLKKVRTLTKASSFKQKRTTTCSSTLKDSKFPSYLELNPGATEAQGKSKLRVCSYNYCSLNGHHHNSAPPLKRFMSLRRRQLKSQKVNRPQVVSPGKRNTSGVADTIEDFFIDLFVLNKEVATQVSESLSDGPRSDVDFQDNLDQNEDVDSSVMNFIPEGGYMLSSVQNQSSFGTDLEVESSPSVSSDEYSCENSDIQWEEGQIYAISDNVEILTESHCNDDQVKPEFDMENSFGGILGEFNYYPPYFQDEIVEFLCFSDADSFADSESTEPGKEIIEEPVTDEKDEKHSALTDEVPEENWTIHSEKLQDESDVKQRENFSNLIEVTEAQNEDLKSSTNSLESDSDSSDEDNYVAEEIGEKNADDLVLGEREPIKEAINIIPQMSENSGASSAKGETSKSNNDGQKNSSEVKLHSHEDNVVEEQISEMGENNSTEEVDATAETRSKMQVPTKCNPNTSESYSNSDLLESCDKIKKATRSRKEENEAEEEREFNPRGPNFLDIEPDPEDEKVDLRHQEIDDRRNAEEWMLDYALQKTVNQLAPARNKKVALLVEAFDAVLPVPKYK